MKNLTRIPALQFLSSFFKKNLSQLKDNKTNNMSNTIFTKTLPFPSDTFSPLHRLVPQMRQNYQRR